MTADGWRPALVALDIDGTLVDHQGRMPDAVRTAVRRVVDAGVPVVLATGRAWHGTEPIAALLDLPPGSAVASNGAVVVDFPPLRVRRQITFDPREVIAKAVSLVPDAVIAVEEIGRGYRLSGEFPPDELSGELVYETVEQLSAQPVTRVIVRDPGSSEQQFLRLAEALGLHGVSYYIGYSAWLDIAPEGVDKAGGLDVVCDGLGIAAADVLALGDGRNDVEMLEWAGRGVALGQAPPEVRAVADAVTDPFDDGGTVAELARWF